MRRMPPPGISGLTDYALDYILIHERGVFEPDRYVRGDSEADRTR